MRGAVSGGSLQAIHDLGLRYAGRLPDHTQGSDSDAHQLRFFPTTITRSRSASALQSLQDHQCSSLLLYAPLRIVQGGRGQFQPPDQHVKIVAVPDPFQGPSNTSHFQEPGLKQTTADCHKGLVQGCRLVMLSARYNRQAICVLSRGRHMRAVWSLSCKVLFLHICKAIISKRWYLTTTGSHRIRMEAPTES